MGATYIPTRGKKILYSLQDDQTLWDWVQQYEGVPGYPIGGNKIYQDLAAKVSVICFYPVMFLTGNRTLDTHINHTGIVT